MKINVLNTNPTDADCFGKANNMFESLIPISTNSETDFLLTLIPATIIGPIKDPLPASSTPQIMFLSSVNSNPLQLKSIFVAFYPYPLGDDDILGAKSY